MPRLYTFTRCPSGLANTSQIAYALMGIAALGVTSGLANTSQIAYALMEIAALGVTSGLANTINFEP